MPSDESQETKSFEQSPERCAYFEGLFSPYIDGELVSEDRRALAEHLHGCESCSQKFGLTWRAATKDMKGAEGARFKMRGRKRGGRSRPLLVFVMIVAGVAALVLAMNSRGSKRGFELPRGRSIVEDEIAKMVAVQNRLLEVLVDPLRGAELHVSYAKKGEARDYFEAFDATRGKGIAEQSLFLSPWFRAVDTAIKGGKEWDRKAMLASFQQDGLPPLVLVSVQHATEDTILCHLAWGKRSAVAFLIRSSGILAPKQNDASAPGEGRVPRYQLAYLLFREP